jgi:hypothetical protein
VIHITAKLLRPSQSLETDQSQNGSRKMDMQTRDLETVEIVPLSDNELDAVAGGSIDPVGWYAFQLGIAIGIAKQAGASITLGYR